MRKQIKEGDLKAVRSDINSETFRQTCDKYIAVNESTWSRGHADDFVGQTKELCEGKLNTIGLGIGKISAAQVTKADVLPIFNAIAERGANSVFQDKDATVYSVGIDASGALSGNSDYLVIPAK